MKFRTQIICGIIVLLGIVIANRPARVVFHEWRMGVEKERSMVVQQYDHENGLVLAGDAGSIESYTWHRSALVKLGRISLVEFEFSNVMSDSPNKTEIWSLIVRGECPEKIDAEMPYFTDGRPAIIEIWCNPTDVEAWDKFFTSHDH